MGRHLMLYEVAAMALSASSALVCSGGDAASGIRWEPLYEPGVGGAIVSVQVSPHDVRHVLAGGDMLGTGVSFDGGETWSPGLGLATYEMATATFHPSSTNEVWMGSCSGPYKSSDGGRTWEMKRRGMPEPARNRYTMMIEKVLFDPRDPSRMLAFSGSSRRWGACRGFGAVWESLDCGESWTQVGTVTTNGWTSESVEGANIVRAFWGARPSGAKEPRQVHLVADGAGCRRQGTRRKGPARRNLQDHRRRAFVCAVGVRHRETRRRTRQARHALQPDGGVCVESRPHLRRRRLMEFPGNMEERRRRRDMESHGEEQGRSDFRIRRAFRLRLRRSWQRRHSVLLELGVHPADVRRRKDVG